MLVFNFVTVLGCNFVMMLGCNIVTMLGCNSVTVLFTLVVSVLGDEVVSKPVRSVYLRDVSYYTDLISPLDYFQISE